MKYEVLPLSEISVCYHQIELTRSHKRNFYIIRRHWKEFNTLLQNHKIQLGANWEKYAITMKHDGKYYYQCAFPSETNNSPFEFALIPAGQYAKFTHNGPMNEIWNTINIIYKDVIPSSKLSIDIERSMIHFEHYDSNFSWNRQDSTLEIYIPLMD